MIKISSQLEIERLIFKLINDIYEKITTNIFIDERPSVLALKWEARQGCLCLHFLFNIALEFLANLIRQEKYKHTDCKISCKTVFFHRQK